MLAIQVVHIVLVIKELYGVVHGFVVFQYRAFKLEKVLIIWV